MWWAKRVCLESLEEGVLAESSWAPRAASFCWAARPAPILSWSRNRRRRPTRHSPCGLCTGCCQTSSLTGAGRSPWPSPEHELQQQRHALKTKKNTNQTLINVPFCCPFAPVSPSTHPAAPTARSASSGRRCLAGGCGSSASCTGCTRWLCLESVLGTPV